MNWDAVGALAELLGAAGVIVSVIYLANQIRINTKTIKADAAKGTYSDWSNFNFELSKHPNRVEIDLMWQPESNWNDFSHEQQITLGWICRSVVERFEAEYALYEAGILKPEVWEKHRMYCNSFICLPAVSIWWESEKTQPICSDSFINEISSAPKHHALTGGSIYDKSEESNI